MLVSGFAARPDSKEFLRLIVEGNSKVYARDKAFIHAQAFAYVCDHYDAHIKSLLIRVGDLTHGGDTVLAELLEIKKLILDGRK